jgi:threonine aldolase
VGDSCHVFLYEQGGAATIGGVPSRVLPNELDGTIKLESIVAAIRANNIHFPITRLVCLENTHNYCGGRVLPQSYIESVANELKKHNIPLHIDGARIWNAATALGLPLSEMAVHADSMSVCMSKGIGAPAGSLLIGRREWIDRARRTRKALGGGMRQVGVLAAACIVGLTDYENGMLIIDHARAKQLAIGLSSIVELSIDVDAVESNIIIIHVTRPITDKKTGDKVDANSIARDLRLKHSVLCNARNSSSIRLVTHRDLKEGDVEKTIAAFKDLFDSYTVETH